VFQLNDERLAKLSMNASFAAPGVLCQFVSSSGAPIGCAPFNDLTDSSDQSTFVILQDVSALPATLRILIEIIQR
jgi:hypothetical protein